MEDEILQRQVALVSYGNRFLSKELALDEMFRHGVFYAKRLLFRAPDDNALLADDFTLWLDIVRGLGARRLSLHPAARFNAATTCTSGDGEYVIVVHYAGHCELWVGGEELASWWRHPALSEGGYDGATNVPSAAYYGGAIDSYWRVEEIQGSIVVPDTQWQAVAAAIGKDVQLTVQDAKNEAFYAPMYGAPDWAHFPLFPYAESAPLPHQLLKVLTDAQSKFANDTHCKNENGYFQHMSAQAAAEKMRWSARLDQWIVDLQLLCANEVRHPAALSMLAESEPKTPSFEPEAPAAVAPAQAKHATSKWFKAAVFATLVAVVSLLLLALGHMMVAYPWLALVPGLLFAVYVYRKGFKE